MPAWHTSPPPPAGISAKPARVCGGGSAELRGARGGRDGAGLRGHGRLPRVGLRRRGPAAVARHLGPAHGPCRLTASGRQVRARALETGVAVFH